MDSALPASTINWHRLARQLTIATCVTLVGLYLLAYMLSDPFTPRGFGVDTTAYWNAAERLRDGLPLYPVVANEGASDVYRYAPWFAVAWIPLTYLPQGIVFAGWCALSMLATAYLLLPLARTRSLTAWLLLILMAPQLLQLAWFGNVGTLMLAPLAWGITRRSGPVWIGLVASLKITPLAFAFVYLVRREYGRAVLSVLIAVMLWAMVLPFGIEHSIGCDALD